MQNVRLKKLSLFLYIIYTAQSVAYSQGYMQQIKQADSLFARGNFTSSLKTYKQVLSQTGKASPGILLKIAYIQEGLKDYTQALYYLSLYYSYKPSQQIIDRMKDIASQHNLKGYEFKDADFFMVLYQRYYIYITFILLLICFISLASLTSRKIRKQYVPTRHGIGFILFLVVVFLFLNIKKNLQKAIIIRDNVYLMNAPSAGAKLISVIPKGHRLEVKGKQDIWLEVIWNNQTAFIRQQNVLLIQ